MLDNALFALIRSVLLAGLSSRGYSGIAVKQAYQPIQQGADESAFISVFKSSDKRMGFLGVSEDSTREEVEYYTTFQVSALVKQQATEPPDLTALTSSDLVCIAADILQSEQAITQMIQANVGILRIDSTINQFFTDDKGQYQSIPNFNFVLAHVRDYALSLHYVDKIDPTDHEV